ncbi:MAG TPA: ABC transporter ATP-binding protein [candidate division Zixibacteria bacterium]|nr:ABC transporter ATP-binding protein [candidate division Zixibacteria bacterium]
MSDTVIRVENLSKCYRIGAAQAPYDTLRDKIAGGLASVFSRNGRPPTEGFVWALKDVSFDVSEGEVVGIIGKNGAGKSTLLKILSRITEPTAGRAEIRGRLGCLLEVGTGFHPELTGRENIYLSGAILGMRKTEIDRKFDEIVAFSEVEKFIDTAVKHYSSGMYVRLAFAVAAHLEPEILVVDEVLAVGDIGFQNKCLGKMGDVARQGRTVLFVSHNMGAIANLCTAAIWLDGGKIALRGDVTSIIGAYVKNSTAPNRAEPGNYRRVGTGEARIRKARLLDTEGQERETFSMGETIVVDFDVEFYQSLPAAYLSLQIKRVEMGLQVVHLESQDCGFVPERVSGGCRRRYRVEIPNCLLYPASYHITLCVWAQGATYDYVADVLTFTMVQSNVSKRTFPLNLNKQAIYYMPSYWRELSE